MKTRIIMVCAAIGALFAACSSLKDTHAVKDSYDTPNGYVDVAYWNRPDGSIELWNWSEKATSDEFLLGQWKNYATKLAKGRRFEAKPVIEAVDYDWATRLQDPHRAGEEPHVSKHAKGIIKFLPAISAS